MRARRQYYPQLDGVRGVAILGVLVGHIAQRTFDVSSPLTLGCAECGVLLFFVLSGYLITDLLLREEESSDRIDLRAFYIRRALRLLPAMFVYLGVLATLKLAGLIGHETWGSIGAAILYVRNIFGRGYATSHLWSLSLEEQFYLSWPAIFVIARRWRRNVIVAIIAAMGVWRAAAVALHLTNISSGQFYQAPWFRYDSILYGCALAVGAARGGSWGRGRWFRLSCHPLITLSVLVAATGISPTSSLYGVRLTAQSLATAGLLWWAIGLPPQAVAFRWLASRPMRYLGRISYALYLWQGLFIWLPGLGVEERFFGRFRTLPLNIALSLAAAIASYELIERRFLRLKDRMTTSRAEGLPDQLGLERKAV